MKDEHSPEAPEIEHAIVGAVLRFSADPCVKLQMKREALAKMHRTANASGVLGQTG
jgi:hypothetical protein